MNILGLLEKGLNIRAYNHKVLASNIANVDTPGYKQKEIDYRAELDRAESRTEDIKVTEKTSFDGSTAIDGNTVNIEDQIINLTENTMMFTSFVQLINKKFSMLKYAISEGRR